MGEDLFEEDENNTHDTNWNFSSWMCQKRCGRFAQGTNGRNQ